jgi:hypothetical protein
MIPKKVHAFDTRPEESRLSGSLVQHQLDLQGYGHSQVWPQRVVYPSIRVPLVRELGFRLGLHDVSVACMLMMSIVMEPGEGGEEEEGLEEEEGEGEDNQSAYGGE